MLNIIFYSVLSVTQVSTMLEDCHIAGLEYNNITNITRNNTMEPPFNLKTKNIDGQSHGLWNVMNTTAYQEAHAIRDRGIFVYDQWCQITKGKEVGYTFFKPALKQDVLANKLKTCRDKMGITAYKPNVLILALKLNYVPAYTYADIKTSVWSLQPTTVTCHYHGSDRGMVGHEIMSGNNYE